MSDDIIETMTGWMVNFFVKIVGGLFSMLWNLLLAIVKFIWHGLIFLVSLIFINKGKQAESEKPETE